MPYSWLVLAGVPSKPFKGKGGKTKDPLEKAFFPKGRKEERRKVEREREKERRKGRVVMSSIFFLRKEYMLPCNNHIFFKPKRKVLIMPSRFPSYPKAN